MNDTSSIERLPLVNGMGLVAWDSPPVILSANDILYALIGADRQECELAGNDLRALLPQFVLDALNRMLYQASSEDICWRGSLPTLHGQPRTVQVSLSPAAALFLNESRPLFHMVVTDLAALETSSCHPFQPREELNYIQAFFDDILFEYQIETDVMRFAEKFEAVFGLPPVMTNFSQLTAQSDPEANDIRAAFQHIFQGCSQLPPKKVFDVPVRTRDGSRRWFSIFWTVAPETHGRPLKAVGALRDINEQKTEQMELQDKARTDSMTGLLNKQTTRDEVEVALRAIQPGTFGVLMMLDIDNFKLVNDTMGHQAGDAVITQIAQHIGHLFRRDDIIGRVGGDEFHVFMRNVKDLSNVRDRAAALCRGVRSMFTDSNLGLEVSLSVGIAYTAHPVSYDDLYGEADIALYRAKSRGKDRYEIFSELSLDKEELSPLDLHANRDSLMANLVEILFATPHLDRTLDNAMSLLGKALNLDRVSVLEKSLDGLTVNLTHEWAAKPEWRRKETLRNRPVHEIPVDELFKGRRVYCCSDTESLSPEERARIGDDEVSALVQCALLREENTVGYIRFEERGRKHSWSRQEVDTLLLMATLISELIRRRASLSLMRKNYLDLRNLLDNLPHTSVYVTRRDTFELLYFNDQVRRLFPGIEAGQTCHHAFVGSDSTCHFCHCVSLDEKTLTSKVHYNTIFGPSSRITVSTVLWEHALPAYITLVTDYEMTPLQKEQQSRLEVLSKAMSDAYDNVMCIDPHNDTMELLSANEVVAPDFTGGNYTEYHNYVCDTRILPPDNEEVRRIFSVEYLAQAFDQGHERVELVFRRDLNGTICWKHRRAVSFRGMDGNWKIIVYNQDITNQRR